MNDKPQSPPLEYFKEANTSGIPEPPEPVVIQKTGWPRIVRKKFFEMGEANGISRSLLKTIWKYITGFKISAEMGKPVEYEWSCDRPADDYRNWNTGS